MLSAVARRLTGGAASASGRGVSAACFSAFSACPSPLVPGAWEPFVSADVPFFAAGAESPLEVAFPNVFLSLEIRLANSAPPPKSVFQGYAVKGFAEKDLIAADRMR